MFKNLTVMEVKAAEDRLHRYECPPDSPLGEVHDSLCAMKAFVLKQMQEQADKDKPEEEKKEECKEACAEEQPKDAE